MRFWGLAVAALACTACLQVDINTCASGLVCPAESACRIAAGTEVCATNEQVAACTGTQNGLACAFAGVDGTCFDGVCLPAACGNQRTDVGEACDDANDVVGDGCSQSCRSDESCSNGFTDTVKLVDNVPTANEQCDDANLVAHDGCSSTCRAEFPAWTMATLSAPKPRERVAMVYDAARDRIVAFGGNDPNGSTKELWEWNGRGWKLIDVTLGPGARSEHAMAYDASNGTTVLFGGTAGGVGAGGAAPSDDTWLWDGASWTNVNPAARPQPRFAHKMAYDAKRKRVVLFGGYRPNVNPLLYTTFSDTWEWYDGNWHQVCSANCGPVARFDQAMEFDPKRGVIVMFGGFHRTSNDAFAPSGSAVGDVLLQDTWEYDGTWRLVDPATKPPGRWGAGMAFDPQTNRLVLSGGVDLAFMHRDDTWLWDGQQWQVVADRTAAVAFHGIATDTLRGTVIALGGGTPNATHTDTTRSFSRDSWSVKTITATPIREQAAAAVDTLRGRTVLFGGTESGPEMRETFELDRDGEAWMFASSTGPTARTNHAMAYDPIRKYVVMHGGRVNGAHNAETWTWDGTMWTPRTNGPAGLADHVMAFDGKRVIAFGGTSDGIFSDETLAWDGATWSVLPVTGPSARIDASVAFDPIRQRVVLFGGYSIGLHNDDTWEWDGSAWQQVITPSSPPARSGAALAWDHARQRMVMFGGGVFEDGDDTWEYDGQTWTPLPLLTRPSPRGHHLLFDASHGVLSHWRGELWRLRWENFARDEVCSTTLDADGDGLRGCDDPDCAIPCATCGNGTCDPIESCRTCPGDCMPCNACGDFVCDAGESAATCAGDCP